ncbi:hypothetical protein GmRootV59_32410 [Variovorax sp. V59]
MSGITASAKLETLVSAGAAGGGGAGAGAGAGAGNGPKPGAPPPPPPQAASMALLPPTASRDAPSLRTWRRGGAAGSPWDSGREGWLGVRAPRGSSETDMGMAKRWKARSVGKPDDVGIEGP